MLGISQEEYQQRRQHVLEAIGPGAMAIIPNAKSHLRNGDSHYPYRSDSSF